MNGDTSHRPDSLSSLWRVPPIEDGRAVKSYIFVDLIDLLSQIGRWPLTVARVGEEFLIPGPIAGDGLVTDLQDASGSE